LIVSGSNAGAYSNDGLSWQTSTLPSSANWNRIKYINNQFIITSFFESKIAYSSNGADWTEITGKTVTDIDYFKGLYIATIGSGVSYSTDLISWTDIAFTTVSSWVGICKGGNIIVASNNNPSNKFAYSYDGLNWTESTVSTSSFFEIVIYVNNTFYFISSPTNKVSFSTNLITWTTMYLVDNVVHFPAYGNGRLIVVSSGLGTANYLDIKKVTDLNYQRINYDAKDIWFDKRKSSLYSDNAQDAIDELTENAETLIVDVSNKLTALILNYYDNTNPETCSIGETCFNKSDGKVYTATAANTWDSGVAASIKVFYIFENRLYNYISGNSLNPLDKGRILEKTATLTSNAFVWDVSGEESIINIENNADTACKVTPISGDVNVFHELMFSNTDSVNSHTLTLTAASGFTIAPTLAALTIPKSGFVEVSAILTGTVIRIIYKIS
jgi:hypothetical protein